MDFKGFFGNWFVRNVIAACVVVLALVFVANFFSRLELIMVRRSRCLTLPI